MVGFWLWELWATQKLFYLRFYWCDALKFHHWKTAQTGTPHSLVKCSGECFRRGAIFVLPSRDFAVAWTWTRTSLFSLFFFLPPLDRCDRQQAKNSSSSRRQATTPINKPWILRTTGIYLQRTAANIGVNYKYNWETRRSQITSDPSCP